MTNLTLVKIDLFFQRVPGSGRKACHCSVARVFNVRRVLSTDESSPGCLTSGRRLRDLQSLHLGAMRSLQMEGELDLNPVSVALHSDSRVPK